MLNTKSTLIALLSAAMLTACGGGGGDGTAADAGTEGGEGTAVDARAKYVGTWTSGCDFEPTNFYIKSSFTLRTQGAADLVGDYSEQNYTDSNCATQSTELKPRACMTARDEALNVRGFWVWNGLGCAASSSERA